MENLYRFKPEELPLGKTILLNLVGCFLIALIFWSFLLVDFVVILLHSVLIGSSVMLLIKFGLPALDRLGLRSFRWETAVRVGFIILSTLVAYFVGSVIARLSLGMPVAPLFEMNGWQQETGEDKTVLATIFAALAMTSFFAVYHRFMSFKLDNIKAKELEEQAKRRAADAQLAMLKAQIEPHMIFNTLATIRALIGSEPELAQNMMDKFIQFLRITLSGSQNPTVDLKTEFAMLENYLSLWKFRLGERLTFNLNLPTELQDFRLPSLLLQPLVENAVRHGIEPDIQGGTVNVTVNRLKYSVIITVYNTGKEMDLEAIQRNADSGTTEKNDSSGLGLEQLKSRLHSYYNGNASYKIKSSADNGTTISIRINTDVNIEDTAMTSRVSPT